MDNIIEKLFTLLESENPTLLENIPKEEIEKEWDLYFLILERLSKRDSALFSEYLTLRQNREDEEKKNAYALGFKTAIQLLLQSLQE